MNADNYIRYWREKKGHTQATLADKANVSRDAVAKIETGKRRGNFFTLSKIAEALQVSIDELKHGPSSDRSELIRAELDMSRIPLLAQIPAGDWREWIDDYPVGCADNYVPRFGISGEHTFAIEVMGDSMIPELYPGDLLIIDPEKPFTNVKGGIGIVKYDSVYKIRRIYQTGSHYRLEPANRAYEEESIPVNEAKIFKISLHIPGNQDKKF